MKHNRSLTAIGIFAFVEESGRLEKLRQQRASLKAQGNIAYAMRERAGPATAYVLFRGEYDQWRDQVMPAAPQSLPPFPAEFPRNRLPGSAALAGGPARASTSPAAAKQPGAVAAHFSAWGQTICA